MVFFFSAQSGLSPFTQRARAAGRPAGVVFRGHRVRPPAGLSGRVRAIDWTDARSRAARREKDLRTGSLRFFERSSRWRGGASPETKRSGVVFFFARA